MFIKEEYAIKNRLRKDIKCKHCGSVFPTSSFREDSYWCFDCGNFLLSKKAAVGIDVYMRREGAYYDFYNAFKEYTELGYEMRDMWTKVMIKVSVEVEE